MTKNEIFGIIVCINAADRLAVTLEDLRHFNYACVVTVPDDVETILLCQENQIAFITEPDAGLPAPRYRGRQSTSATLKAAFTAIQMRAPLEEIFRGDLCICIKSVNLVLPEAFHELVDLFADHVSPDVLCVGGYRRDISNVYSFEALRATPFGFPTRISRLDDPCHWTECGLIFMKGLIFPRGSIHQSFLHELGATLETLILAAAPIELPFVSHMLNRPHGEILQTSVNQMLGRSFNVERQFCDALKARVHSSLRGKHVLVIGCLFPRILEELGEINANITLLDYDNLFTASPIALDELGRSVFVGKFCSATHKLNRFGYTPYSSESRRNVGPFDVVLLNAEPSYDLLIEIAPLIRRQMAGGGKVIGSYYGYPHFPQSTPTIELLLGSPEYNFNAPGYWELEGRALKNDVNSNIAINEKRIATAPTETSAKADRGILLFAFANEDARAIIVALASLREVWDGEIAILQWEEEVPPVRIAASLYNALYFAIVSPLRDADTRFTKSLPTECIDRRLAQIITLPLSPFSLTLWTTPSSRVPDPEAWFSAVTKETPIVFYESIPQNELEIFSYLRDSNLIIQLVESYRAEWKHNPPREFVPDKASRTQVDLKPLQSLPARCITNGIRGEQLKNRFDQSELLTRFKVAVHIAPESTIITVVTTDEEIDILRHNWASIQWNERCKRRIYFSGLDHDVPECFLPERSEVAVIDPNVFHRHGDEPPWMWAILSEMEVADTKRIIYIDSYMKATPGASLFADVRSLNERFCSPGWTFEPVEIGGRKLSKVGSPATLFESTFLREAAAFHEGQSDATTFESSLGTYLNLLGRTPHVINIFDYGWER